MGDGSETDYRVGGIAVMRVTLNFESTDGKRRNTKPVRVNSTASLKRVVDAMVALQEEGFSVEFKVESDDRAAKGD